MTTIRSKADKAVYDIIKTNRQATCKMVCEETGMTPRQVSGILKKLRFEGHITIIESKSHCGNVWSVA